MKKPKDAKNVADIFQNNNNNSCSKRLYLNERKHKIITQFVILALVIVFVAATCCVSFMYYGNTARNYIRNQNLETMTNVSTQLSESVSDKIQDCFEELNIVKQFVALHDAEVGNSTQADQVFEELRNLEFDLFDDVGVLTDDGTFILASGPTFDVSNDEVVRAFMNSETNGLSYTPNIASLSDKILFAVPIESRLLSNGKNVVGILGTMRKKTLSDIMESYVFGKTNGYVVISDNNGKVLVDTESSRHFGNNMLDTFATFADADVVDSLRQDLQLGKTDTKELMGVTQRFVIFYCPVLKSQANILGSTNDWRLMILTSTYVLEKNIQGLFQESQTYLYAVLFSTLLCLVVISILSESKSGKLMSLQSTDRLTGLLNNRRFNADANLLIRNGGSQKYAVVSINLVQFKMLNNRVGRDVADEVLCIVSNGMKKFLRSDELAARLYSDRFLVLLNMETDAGNNRLSMLEQAIVSQEYPDGLDVHVIMGVYRFQDNDADIVRALDSAHFALSTIHKGHAALSNVAFFDEASFKQQQRNALLEKMAVSALENKQFVVHYQLMRRIGSPYKWGSCEALVRWQNDELGFLFPGEFIELFEKSGFIVKLDDYVFQTVCQDLRRSLDAGERVIPVSINLSRRHLERKGFLDIYSKFLEQYQIPRELIEFELTETMAMENEDRLREVLEKIHKIGCRCALDDFGSGYSSFKMVRDFKFDTIKLDASFFRGVRFDENTKLIVEALIELSHSLGMEVVAEGIETAEQVQFLTEKKCDKIQGYYFARPCSYEKCRELLDAEL